MTADHSQLHLQVRATKSWRMDLFAHANQTSLHRPLAERLRPKTLNEMVGQPKLLFGGSRWRKQIEAIAAGGPAARSLRLPSLLLFGPPGCGKTTFARIICSLPEVHTEICHAVETGAKQLKEVCDRARYRQAMEQKRTVVFVDEIHRLNRAQQDVLLASVEAGDVSLVGATTENPSHALNPALISRSQVLAFEELTAADLTVLAERGFAAMGFPLEAWLKPEAVPQLLALSDGDARKLLNAIEWLCQSAENQMAPAEPLTGEQVTERLGELAIRFDRAGSEHYDTISALIKSIRGSDPDAALYYLARLTKAGEDVAFIGRRLVVLAAEDIGNADPRALQLAVSCLEGVARIGWPEARILFAQTVTYLACAPKSNASYLGISKALECVERFGSLPIPLALRSSKTTLSKSLGYGRGYRYAHESERGFVEQNFVPQEVATELAKEKFYEPSTRGFEKTMQRYQAWIRGKPSPFDTLPE